MSKIALTPNASGSGTFTIASPNSDTDRTLDLPDGAGTLDRLERAGNVLQVVQSTFGSEVDVNSSTYVDSGLSGTITPTSTSSKILILVTMAASGSYETAGAQSIGQYRLYDGTNEIYSSVDRMYDYGSSGGFAMKNQVITCLHSPSTTSAITIKLQMKLNAGDQFRINNDGSKTGGPSVMILQEIAG